MGHRLPRARPRARAPGRLRPKGPASTVPLGASSSSGKKAKRSRDFSPSGKTPPPKRPSKNIPYAEAAAGSLELVIFTERDGHIRQEVFNDINQAVQDDWIRCLDEGVQPFHVERWRYTNHFASVWVKDDHSAYAVEKVVNSKGYVLKRKTELLESRKPITILSGLVKGPAANSDRGFLERCLKFEIKRTEIPGRLEFYQAVDTTAGNKILKVLADEDAMLRLAQLDFELCNGTSGRVKFLDERASKKSNPQSRKLKAAQLDKEIEELKARFHE